MDAIAERPAFYNALLESCTTGIRVHTKDLGTAASWHWRLPANAAIDHALYERGRIAAQLPFDGLRERSWIDARPQAADADPDFSRRIRE